MPGVMVQPRGPLQSGEGGLDLGCPRALSSGAFFPYVHDVLDVTGDDVLLFDDLLALCSRDVYELSGWF
jgi:hypothetical protein